MIAYGGLKLELKIGVDILKGLKLLDIGLNLTWNCLNGKPSFTPFVSKTNGPFGLRKKEEE